MVQIPDAVLVLDLMLSLENVVEIVCLLRLFTDALLQGLLPFVFPFMFCSETKRATAFDFYDRISVMWIMHFLGCNSSGSFHCSIPHYPKPPHG
jgi:hypothetical protein